jgi:lysozyme
MNPFLLIAVSAAFGLWFVMNQKSVDLSQSTPDDQANVSAFLKMIQVSEGTANYPDPYGTYYGGGQFSDKSDHPVITGAESPVVTKWGVTTAAGAYQITLTTWASLGGSAHYGDFSNIAQDQAAIDLINRRGALDAVMSGDLQTAFNLLRNEWASLPTSPAGQPTQQASTLIAAFQANGGTLA